MQIKIIHETEYDYAAQVFFEPHIFRFKPRTTPYAELSHFNLEVVPKPIGISEQTDAENNTVHFAWFEGMHRKMRIKATSILSAKSYNPFNFLVSPERFNQLPFNYGNDLNALLRPYLEKMAIGMDLIVYGDAVIKLANNDTLTFLSALTNRIHKDFILEIRDIGEPYPPDETFRLKIASCRDLAWMQIQLLRHYGMAARFASGYFYVDIAEPKYELHGWTEVFIPGAGWIGYDPSNGIRTSNMHFPMCSSASYQNTMPVSGSVRGGATSVLITSLSIRVS